ncbi:hypothetical protein CABS02_15464 [Colletotrichum abscissum]|uniref:Uncharacterized protein n=1 Tax=Colletotrichum abscissum TaxID=1671311 RepID=A0A9Q0ASJ3_9PEZI|nr:hypothetical protein CABS02_15464 [Colletotrichum abscissum]
MDDQVVTSHAYTICRRNFLVNGDWEKLGESGMFVAEFLLWMYALMRITYSSQVRSWQLFLTQTQKLERVVHDAAQRLCDEFPTHCGCSQSDIRTGYSIYRPDRARQAKTKDADDARAQTGQNTWFLSMLSPDLPAEQKIDERQYGEADVSLVAVTETIATVLDLVYVLYAEEYGYSGED